MPCYIAMTPQCSIVEEETVERVVMASGPFFRGVHVNTAPTLAAARPSSITTNTAITVAITAYAYSPASPSSAPKYLTIVVLMASFHASAATSPSEADASVIIVCRKTFVFTALILHAPRLDRASRGLYDAARPTSR